MTNSQVQELINAQWVIIHNNTAKLAATDYIASKIAEGAATMEEYIEKINMRQTWREEINAAQIEIERLSQLEVEDEDIPVE